MKLVKEYVRTYSLSEQIAATFKDIRRTYRKCAVWGYVCSFCKIIEVDLKYGIWGYKIDPSGLG
jgi:hypothetical protein